MFNTTFFYFQLILYLSFNQAVKLHSMRIKGPASNGPKTLKLFINQPHTIDFDTAESANPVQELTWVSLWVFVLHSFFILLFIYLFIYLFYFIYLFIYFFFLHWKSTGQGKIKTCFKKSCHQTITCFFFLLYYIFIFILFFHFFPYFSVYMEEWR